MRYWSGVCPIRFAMARAFLLADPSDHQRSLGDWKGAENPGEKPIPGSFRAWYARTKQDRSPEEVGREPLWSGDRAGCRQVVWPLR